jgi:RimJ/RimL family protein N-acetyltransferase
MRLVPLTAADEDLAVRIECDPDLMTHIGGPCSEHDVRASHKRRLALMNQGDAHMYKILDDTSDAVVGTIGIWKIDWKGPHSWEIGWFVLAEHQGKGVATEAASVIVSQSRADPLVRQIYVFSTTTNTASNAIARKLGMQLQGEFDNEGFAGVLRCNECSMDLD